MGFTESISKHLCCQKTRQKIKQIANIFSIFKTNLARISKFIFFPVLTDCLEVQEPLRPPRKKSVLYIPGGYKKALHYMNS